MLASTKIVSICLTEMVENILWNLYSSNGMERVPFYANPLIILGELFNSEISFEIKRKLATMHDRRDSPVSNKCFFKGWNW